MDNIGWNVQPTLEYNMRFIEIVYMYGSIDDLFIWICESVWPVIFDILVTELVGD